MADYTKPSLTIQIYDTAHAELNLVDGVEDIAIKLQNTITISFSGEAFMAEAAFELKIVDPCSYQNAQLTPSAASTSTDMVPQSGNTITDDTTTLTFKYPTFVYEVEYSQCSQLSLGAVTYSDATDTVISVDGLSISFETSASDLTSRVVTITKD